MKNQQNTNKFRTINLGFTVHPLMKSHARFKVLLNTPSLHCALLFDGKNILEYDYVNLIENSRISLADLNETKIAVNAVYITKYELYMIIFEGWKLHIFRRNMQLLRTQHFDCKYQVGLHYYNETDTMLLIGVDVIDQIQFQVETNVKSAKFLSSFKFELNQIKKISFDEGLDWNKGFFANPKENQLFLWGQKDLKMLNLTTGKAQLLFMGIAKKENPICSFLLHDLYNYFLIGHFSGAIKVWKLCEGKQSMHTYISHTKSVDSMVQHHDPRYFWSASSDQTIQLFNLDTFTSIYVFNITFGQITEMNLLNSDQFLCEKDQTIYVVNLINNRQLIKNFQAAPIYFCKQYDPQLNELKGIVITHDNNSACLLWVDAIAEFKDKNKMPIGNLFSHPKCKQILQVLPSPYRNDLFYMLLENGEICITKMERGTGNYVSILRGYEIEDFDKHLINQFICSMSFIDMQMPFYDVDSGLKKTEENEKLRMSQPKDQLICFGLNKGSIVFLSISDQYKLFCKISFHREKIAQVVAIWNKFLNKKLLISLCEERMLKVIALNQFNVPEQQFSLKVYSSHVNQIISHQQYLFSIGKHGFLLLLRSDAQCNLVNKCNEDSPDHEGEILSLDIFQTRKVFLTAATDNKIKIWTFRKILLLQIQIDDKLEGAININNQNDILICHNGYISYVKYENIKFAVKEIKKQNSQSKQKRLNILISDQLGDLITKQLIQQKQDQIIGNKKLLSLGTIKHDLDQSILESQKERFRKRRVIEYIGKNSGEDILIGELKSLEFDKLEQNYKKWQLSNKKKDLHDISGNYEHIRKYMLSKSNQPSIHKLTALPKIETSSFLDKLLQQQELKTNIIKRRSKSIFNTIEINSIQ